MREGERRWAVSSTIGESERASSTERGSSARTKLRVTRSSFLFSLSLSFYYYYFYYFSYLLFNPFPSTPPSYRFFYLVLPRYECFFLPLL